MNTMTKNLLIVTTLAVLSANAFSQVRRADDDRRRHYRDHHRNMDICQDIRQDLVIAEEAYLSFVDKVEAADRKISEQRRVVRSRTDNLERKKNAYETAKIQVAELEQLKKDKPRLMAENQSKLNDANAQLPGLLTIKNQKQRTKDEKCKGLVRVGRRARECKEAKRELDTANDNYNRMNNQKVTAENTIARLNRVDSDLTRTKSILTSALQTLSSEQQISPSIQELSTALGHLEETRRGMNGQLVALEDEFGRLEVRLDMCQEMRYAARNGKAFKRALLVFAENNGMGCEKLPAMLRGAQGPAARDGIKEAHQLYCVDETLVRVVEVPGAQPQDE